MYSIVKRCAVPIVTFPQCDYVNIYGHCGDDPEPMWIEVCPVQDAERRVAELSCSMCRAWHLVVYRKVTLSKNSGFRQKRAYKRRRWPKINHNTLYETKQNQK